MNAIQPSVFVSGVPETVTFSGIGITVRDSFGFVEHGVPCELMEEVYSLTNAVVDVVNGEVTLQRGGIVVSAPVETRLDVCYKLFAMDSFIVLPGTPVVTPNVISMHNEEDEADLFYVSNKPMSFIVHGPAVGREEEEKLRLVDPTVEGCDDYLLEVPAMRQVDGYARVSMTLNVDSQNVLGVCYRFHAIGFQRMNVMIPVLKVNMVYNGREHAVLGVCEHREHVLGGRFQSADG